MQKWPLAAFSRVITVLFLTVSSAYSGKYDSVVKAFESKPNYVVPAATLLGSLTGNGWNQHAKLGKEFSFSLSLPITIAVLSDQDRTYEGVYVPQAYADFVAEKNITNPHHLISQPYETATIFGKKAAPTLYEPDIDIMTGGVADSTPVLLSDGIENLAKFNWFPMASIQMQWQFHNTAIKLRASMFPGIGVQHDISSFAPNVPLDITIFHNHSFQIINWEPGNDITGQLELRGNTGFTGFTMGKQLANDVLQIFLESGIEYSTLKTGGDLFIKSENERVLPNLTIKGRSNFRVGLHMTVTPGRKRKYSLSGGGGYGTGQHWTVTPVLVNFQGQKRDSATAKETKKSQ